MLDFIPTPSGWGWVGPPAFAREEPGRTRASDEASYISGAVIAVTGGKPIL